MRRRSLAPWLALPAIALAASCGPPATATTVDEKPKLTGPAHVLRLKETEGATYTQSFVIDAASDPSGIKDKTKWPKHLLVPSTFHIEGIVKFVVVDVKDGKTTFKAVNIPAQGSGTGFGKDQAAEVMQKGQMSQKYTVGDRWDFPDSKTVLDPLANTMNGLYPKNGVRVGETWEYKPFPDSANAKATLEALETVAGVECGRILIDVPGGDKEDTVMKAWIGLKNGRLVKAQIRSKDDSDGMKFTSLFEQVLVP